ncbi:MAG: SLOG family protein [Rikenellaceae bacterium]
MNIAFTGHRDFPHEKYHLKLSALIEQRALTNTTLTLWCGMAVGFDMSAAECAIELRTKYPHIEVVGVVPFRDQPDLFSQKQREEYFRLLDLCDRVEVLSEEYTPRVYHQRNDYLLAHCDELVAFHNGSKKGGTAYTVTKARRLKILTTNLFEDIQQKIPGLF